jgi:chaperonin cofactor prefoldin
MLDERSKKLDERETAIERRLGELKDREKRLAAREASLEAKLNRSVPLHSSL